MSTGNQRYWAPGDFAQICQIERDEIAERTKLQSKGRTWTGISLSGGGIRSAAFCLGVLQAMARTGILSQIDYVSTVSGGGYVGAGLQWWLHEDPDSGANKENFPYGVDPDLQITPAQGQSTLQYLRWHANYLLPGHGLDIFSAITVILRTACLSLAIWFPLIVLIFLILQFATASLPQTFASSIDDLLPTILRKSWLNPGFLWPDNLKHLYLIYTLSLWVTYVGVIIIGGISLLVAFISITKFPQSITILYVFQSVAYSLIGLAILGGDYLLIDYIAATFGEAVSARPDIISLVVSGVSLLVGLVFLLPGINLLGLLIFRERYKNADYTLRRFFETVGGRVLRYTTYALAFGSIPLFDKYIFTGHEIPSSVIPGILGIVSASIGLLGQSRRVNLGTIGRTLLAAASGIFLYGILLAGFHVSSYVHSGEYFYPPALLTICIISMLFGISSNSNTTGLHRYYRDRLMELFMPSRESVRQGRSQYSFAADRLSVRESWSRATKQIGLFPIVNCNAILVNDPEPVVASRGGANFAVTPLHVGGSAHGWESNKSYEGKNRELSLATAVAASGAAANSNSGYVGTGVTRDRLVSLVLMLFNIRLGVWIRRPSDSPRTRLLKPTPFFPALWYGPFAQGYKARSAFVEISDGGHFENLGVYELVRRKVDLILACDGEADPSTSLPALVSLTRRIEEDFGASLTFDSNGLDEIIPFASQAARYPSEAKFAKLPCVKGTITYADAPNKKTILIYIKATLIDPLPFLAKGYRAQHPAYPNESTADQFYSPAQFDAYRELGVTCAEKALKDYAADIASVMQAREPRAINLTIEQITAPTPDLRDLIGELDAVLNAAYEPHQRHGLAIAQLFEPHVRFFVARLDGAAVACGGVALFDGYAEVKRMYTRPALRGRGVAKAVLRRLEEEARGSGITMLRLETGLHQAEAVGLYRRAGFTGRGAFGDYAQMPARDIETSLFFEKPI